MILVNGQPVEAGAPAIAPTDRGLTLADGLFETMLAIDNRIDGHDAHIDRMMAGLAVIDLAVSRARLEGDLGTVLRQTGGAPTTLRLTVTRGSGARGLLPPADPRATVIVTAAPHDCGLVGEATTLATAAIRRNDRSPLSQLKSLSYLDNILALKVAQDSGARDALLLNTADRVACSTVGNVFRLTGDCLETPPACEGVLPGIIRGRLLARAVEIGLTARERPLEVADLLAADGVFITNSVRLLQPVTALDGKALSVDPKLTETLDFLKKISRLA